MMLRFGHHALSIGLTTLLLAGCGGQVGTPAAPSGIAQLNDAAPGTPVPIRANSTLSDEVLSGTYYGSCTNSKLQFVAEGDAMGPVKGTFTAYGTWKVGRNQWEFQEQFTIKSRAHTTRGTVLGSAVRSAGPSCGMFKSRLLFYFAHHEEGRLHAVIGHFRSSRVFIEEFKRGVRDRDGISAR
jgi:hypothetical protein